MNPITHTLELIMPSDELYIVTWGTSPFKIQETILAIHGPVYEPDIMDGGEVVNPDWWRDAEDKDDEPASMADDIVWYTRQETQVLAVHTGDSE